MKKNNLLIVVVFISHFFCLNAFSQKNPLSSSQYVVINTDSINIGTLHGGPSMGELELYTWNNNPISFNITANPSLQMKKGRNNDFTLFFPLQNKWNRFITGEGSSLLLSAGGRGLSDDIADLFVDSSGNVGIGTTTPDEKLTVAGNLKLNNGKLFVNINVDDISEDNRNNFSVFVAGGILSENFIMGAKSSWADHVFNKEYELPKLEEIEKYINLNKHLPDIPSAIEVENNGYSLHDMNVKLLQKIEELTLYSIEQEKEIEDISATIESYNALLDRISTLENKLKK
jgi:hypothetical protein